MGKMAYFLYICSSSPFSILCLFLSGAYYIWPNFHHLSSSQPSPTGFFALPTETPPFSPPQCCGPLALLPWTAAPTSRVNSCSLSTKQLQLIFFYLLLLECSFSLSFPTYLHLLVLATCPSLLYLFFVSPLSPHFPCQVPAQDFGNENTAAMPGKFMACLFLLSTPAPKGKKGKDVLELWNLLDVEPCCVRLWNCTVIQMAYSEQLGSINTEILKYTDCTHFSCHRHQCRHVNKRVDECMDG